MHHAQAPGARLQQQPRRFSDRQQQQSSGSREFQPRQSKPGDAPAGQMGEGSYEGARKYQDNIKSYLKDADVKSDAEAAKPESPQQAAELKKAEEEGRSHSKAPGR
jgi:hypothetical protein